MDNALNALLSWQFILFCLGLTGLTYILRTIVDYCFSLANKIAKDNHLWSNLVLPLLPVFLGAITAFIAKAYPYPLDISSASGRIFFGLCAGLLSGLVWRWIKSAIGNKLASLKTSSSDTNS